MSYQEFVAETHPDIENRQTPKNFLHKPYASSFCIPKKEDTMKSLFRFLTVLLTVALFSSLLPAGHARAAGTIRYAAPGGMTSGSCTSWENACTLKYALSIALSGDQIWVKQGVHYPGTNQSDTFTLKNGVAIYGGFAGTETALNQRDWQTNLTILSGDIDQNDINTDGNFIAETWHDIQANNAYHVVTGGGTNSSAVLDGFVITAGRANSSPNTDGGGMYNYNSSPTLTNVTFSGNFAYNYGGGMYNDNSSPTLTNVIFSGNYAAYYYGGGMYNYNSSPTLTNVTFSGNRADSEGGGMYNWNSSPTLTNVIFSGNYAYFYGGGMRNWHNSSPTLTNVTFSGNTAGDNGGGMYNDNNSSPTLTNVTFSGNSADRGGGMYNDFSNPTLTNVTFSGNYGIGGGMYNSYSSPTLTNVTFSGNYGIGGEMYNEYSSNPTLSNVIMWGNRASSNPEIFNSSANPNISYSDIQGCGGSGSWNPACGTDGGNNIDADPLFVDADGADNTPGTADDNLRLQPGSPAIDAGNNSTVPASVTTDLDGNPRIQDGNGDNSPIVDMGAYEAPDTIPPTVIINQAAGMPDPTSATPILFTAVFSEPINTATFTADDVDLSASTAPGATVSSVTEIEPYDGTTFEIEVSGMTGNGTVTASIPAGVVQDLGGNANLASTSSDNTVTYNDPGPTSTATLYSIGAHDGFIRESTENSNTGGALNALATTFNLGDDAYDRQFRAILSFKTASLPDTATIISVTLKIKRYSIVGTNPFTTHGNILVDIRSGPFGTAGLQLSDFKAPASMDNVARFSNNPLAGNWYSVNINPTAFAYINKTGLTQFRLRFFTDDNDDMGADFLKFFSGDAAAASRPVLIIQYIP